jgi:hypothetical protein
MAIQNYEHKNKNFYYHVKLHKLNNIHFYDTFIKIISWYILFLN